ncbi:proteasome subunit beta [Candidatus Pacearchaeota archaeon]|nr:proteasome subunit beta [Candidatus Pacearchaeota archaeon]
MEDEIKNSILKTGTSILGIVCKDGIVMAADRQVTAGNLVVGKNFRKATQINDYLVVSWTGGVSDAQLLSRIIVAELRLKELRSKQKPSVKDAASLISMLSYRSIRQFSAIPSIVGTLIAGVNEDGTFELYSIEPAGSIVKVEDYDANFGSGMPYILGLLERQYKKDISAKEGINLALEALKSSTQRDVGSGYGIDVFTITKDGIKQVIEQTIEAAYKDKK